MDALSDVLRTVHLKGGVFLHAEFSEPWCLSSQIKPGMRASFLGETSEIIPYHYVIEGFLRVQVANEPLCELKPGGLVLLPRNDAHLLGGDLQLPPTPSGAVVNLPADGGLATIRLGGEGERTRIVCRFLAGENLQANPVISALPALLKLDYRVGPSATWIRNTFSYAADEIAAGSHGLGNGVCETLRTAVRRGDTPLCGVVARRADRLAGGSQGPFCVTGPGSTAQATR